MTVLKVLKFIVLLVLSFFFLAVIWVFEINNWPVGSSLAGLALGFILPALLASFQDLFDTADWKVSQRKLMRGGFIKNDTLVRISFAYLYRIKVGNKYLLVRNARGTEKYQPVGGVYKLHGSEKLELKNRYQVSDDDKISIDESSKDDYRLRLENRHLRKFIKRFDSRKASRESMENLGREFREELIEPGLLKWSQIRYRICGRHITPLEFGKHFQIYEILLADVVELLPTKEQEKDLEKLVQKKSDEYIFATADEIRSLGVNTHTGKLSASIAEHSEKIIQEKETTLIRTSVTGKCYTVDL